MSYNMMIGYDGYLRPFHNGAFSIAPKHDFDDQFVLLVAVLWRTINLGRQISDISKKSMQATIYCHYD
jgi:hypothetical protein